MGSAEGFGAGGVVVKQVRREIQCASSSGVLKDKPQILKQRNNSNCKRGDKRSSKVQKTRCDSFSLRNGLVGFNSAAGGNNFFGLYGLKPDAFDITKYVDEISVDDLLRGTFDRPEIAKDKEKITAKQNDDVLSSVRKACSILQTRKVSLAQKCAEIDNSFIEKISAGLVNVSSPHNSFIEKISAGLVNVSSGGGQTNGENVDSYTQDPTTSHEVQEPADKIKTCLVADSQVYQPKDILQRLALLPPKDLDLLLSDASKASSSSKYSTDLRLSKTVSHRTGLPPFSWSHAFSGHSKLGADAGKLATNRAACPGRWANVRNSVVLQKGCADLLVDFESLTFDENLVPQVNTSRESHQIEQVLTSPAAAYPAVDVPADLPSPTFAAAQTLCDIMAISSSKENSSSVKLLHEPMKCCKFKSVEKSDRLSDAAKSTIKPHSSVKVGENGVPSKRLKLSADVPKLCNGHTDSPWKGTSHWSAKQPFRSPPSKLYRDSNPFSIDFVKTSYMMKPPRAVDRPSSSQQKLKKATVPMKWSRPES